MGIRTAKLFSSFSALAHHPLPIQLQQQFEVHAVGEGTLEQGVPEH